MKLLFMSEYLKKILHTSFLYTLITLTNISLSHADENPIVNKKRSLATQIADHYIPSFYTEAQAEKAAIMQENASEGADHEVRPPRLDVANQRRVIFDQILAKAKNLALTQQEMESILNEYAWNDLKLFYGTTSEPSYHLMAHINKTITTLGEAALATLLVTPTSDLSVIKQRQSIIKTFLDHPQATNQIKSNLKAFQDAEQSVVSFWTDTDPLYTKEYQNYMNGKFYAKGQPLSNKSAKFLETKKRLVRDFWGIQLRFLYPLAFGIIGEMMAGKALQEPGVRTEMWLGLVPYYGSYRMWDKAKAAGRSLSTSDMALRIGMYDGLYTAIAYSGYSNYKEYAAVLRSLALRMADVQSFVHNAQYISDTIAANPALETIYGERLTAVRELLEKSQEDTELGKLIFYLKELPLRNWSYFFNNAGKLLAGHKLFVEHKEAFSDAMYEVGLLDAYLSFSTLVQASQVYHSDHAYVFAQFLDREQQKKPYLKIEDMWNPFLDARKAVGNSIEMDAAGGIRNIILTGPNAGGKSTFLTGVTHTLLLAHVVGIGPAKSITLTPFNRINTYIDISDDIAAGKSLFMAEVDRAQKHIKMLERLKKDEFSFTIFDEPFSGTNPKEGAAAEYSILEAIADYSHTFNLVATHYPTVMLLEERAKGKGFANYKVYITRDKSTKKINYTYKIIPGKSTQAIAIDILEEQGYDVKMLKRAREIIEHPERYQANF